MARKIGVLLSGCGFKDGSEIHESVLTILHIVKNACEPVFMAPDIDQPRVINHLTGEPTHETRNVLVESARIARGHIRDVAQIDASELDALILPGGFGAAANLCSFAAQGPDCETHADVARVIREIHAAQKPIGAVCIAPAVIAQVLGSEHPTLTIGTDRDTAAKLEKMGARHADCPADDFHSDRDRKIVTTPAYMTGKNIADLDAGIGKLVKEVIALMK